jgi:hypothetical protein
MVSSPGENGKALNLVGSATWHGANENEHFGDTKGDAIPSGNRLHYVNGGCAIDLTLAGRYETVTNVWSAARLQGKSLAEKTSLRKCIRPLCGE